MIFSEGDIVIDHFNTEGQIINIYNTYEDIPAKYRILRAVWYDEINTQELVEEWALIGYYNKGIIISPLKKLRLFKRLSIKL